MVCGRCGRIVAVFASEKQWETANNSEPRRCYFQLSVVDKLRVSARNEASPAVIFMEEQRKQREIAI